MSRQSPKLRRQGLSRLLTYVLGHRPDEFGLFLDEQGFVPVKELLAALKEEEGFSFVRLSHLEDLLRAPDRTRFEIKDKLIRIAPEDSALDPGSYEAALPPELLYHAARTRAYPAILERGLRPGDRPYVPLFTASETALKVGRRRDPKPVLLRVHAARAAERGIVFYRPQELIYLVEGVPPELLTGPPLPQEKPAPEKKKREALPPEPPMPGSFLLRPDQGPRPQKKGGKGDAPDWKRAARKERRRRDR